MSEATLKLRNWIMEICCYDVRNRNEATNILQFLESMSDVCTNKVSYGELMTYFHGTNEVSEEILKYLQNIERYDYIFYETLLYVTSSEYEKLVRAADECNNVSLLLSMIIKNCLDESEWAKEIADRFEECPLINPEDYKFYFQGMKKLNDLNGKAVKFYYALEQISTSLTGTEDVENVREFILHMCKFNVKVVDEQNKIIQYLKSHGILSDLIINKHVEIMSTLKLIGWHGTKHYYDLLYKIAEEISYPKTTVSADEGLFHSCCSEILNQQTFCRNERKHIAIYLKYFGQFLLLKNYVLLMQLFHETDGCEKNDPIQKKFLEAVQTHINKLKTVCDQK